LAESAKLGAVAHDPQFPRFSSEALANATLTLLEGRIRGLQARTRRLEVLRAAVRLMRQQGPSAIATEVSER